MNIERIEKLLESKNLRETLKKLFEISAVDLFSKLMDNIEDKFWGNIDNRSFKEKVLSNIKGNLIAIKREVNSIEDFITELDRNVIPVLKDLSDKRNIKNYLETYAKRRMPISSEIDDSEVNEIVKVFTDLLKGILKIKKKIDSMDWDEFVTKDKYGEFMNDLFDLLK